MNTRRVKVAAVALNQTPLDWAGNQKNIEEGIVCAKKNGATVIVLPEMATTGYGCEKAFSFPDVQKRAMKIIQFLEKSEAAKDCVIVIGTPVFFKKSLFNCAAVLVNGAVVGFVAKRFLAGDGNHYEPRYFKPWKPETTSIIKYDGREVPIGDLIFEVDGIRIGVEICEDAWVSDRPGRRMAEKAVDLILSPNASHFSFGKRQTRVDFCRDASRAFNCGIVYANLLGNEAGSMIYAGEAIIASGGNLVAQGKRFSFKPFVVTTAVIDVVKNRANQSEVVSFNVDAADDSGVVQVDSFEWPEQGFEPCMHPLETWEKSDEHLKFEEFSRATALGLWDYLRKTKSQGYAVSLSGGADSVSVCVLLRDMVKFAMKDLGWKGFKEALSAAAWSKAIEKFVSVEEIMADLLYTFYQPAEASGDKTLESARAVAEGIGAKFGIIPIAERVTAFELATETYLARDLSWDNPADDLTLQNIPARVRGIQGWTIANATGRLLIPPGNMSEIMVGYFTQGGDDSGGVNPIGGVRKTFLREWLRWRQLTGFSGPVSDKLEFLSFVNNLQPTAELRPLKEGEEPQTDEGELGTYAMRDYMEELFLWDRLSPLEIFKRLYEMKRHEHSADQLRNWITKFFKLFSINQWKRERLPVTFHLDDHNLSPRLWLRWPVLSANLREELYELDAYVSGINEK